MGHLQMYWNFLMRKTIKKLISKNFKLSQMVKYVLKFLIKMFAFTLQDIIQEDLKGKCSNYVWKIYKRDFYF